MQRRTQSFLTPDQVRLLETFAGQIALAIVRILSSQAADKARLEVESERLRSSLLSDVSHNLQTPLTTLVGASSTLLEGGMSLTLETRQELTKSIYREGERLNRLVGNLLDRFLVARGFIGSLQRQPSHGCDRHASQQKSSHCLVLPRPGPPGHTHCFRSGPLVQ